MNSYFKSSPYNVPRVISEFACEPNREIKDYLIKKCSGNEYIILGIRCMCGSRKVRLVGSDIEGLDVLGDPVSIECSICENKYEIFNSHQQGYDGELGLGVEIDYPDNKPKRFKCSKCDNENIELALAFEYTGEEAEFIKEEGLNVQPGDLYGWLLGTAKCTQCGKISKILDFECS